MQESGGSRSVDFIFFDLGEVVIPVNKETLAKNIAKFSDLSLEKIETILKHGYTSKYRYFWDVVMSFDKGDIYPYEFYTKVRKILKLTLGFKRFLEIWQTMLEVDERFISLIEVLRKQKIGIGIISDLCIVHYNRLWQMMPREIFDIPIFSFLEGTLKSENNGTIFDRAAQAAAIDRDRILFIDDREDNIRTASSKKIRTFHYTKNFEELEAYLITLGIQI